MTDAVEVRWVDLDPDAAVVRDLSALLTDEERARVARRATPELRRRATVSLAQRRCFVADVLGVAPGAVALLTRDDGRRAAAAPGRAPLAISVSTCDDVGLVALGADADVGCDVEDFGEVPPTAAFAERVATDEELVTLDALDDDARRRALLVLWTRKEAYLKATGEGIGAGLRRVAVPTGAGAWGERWRPVAAGPEWFVFDLVAPVGSLAAAVVVGPGAAQAAPVLRLSDG